MMIRKVTMGYEMFCRQRAVDCEEGTHMGALETFFSFSDFTACAVRRHSFYQRLSFSFRNGYY